MKTNKTKTKAKYNVIAKCGEKQEDFKKWRCSNLISFYKFLDKDYPNWQFFTVYDKITRTKLEVFSPSNLPTAKYIRA